MFKALVDAESLINPTFLESYDVIGTYEERWPGEDPEVLHLSKIRIEGDEIEPFIKTLSSHDLEEGWYALVWNDDKAYVIFKNKIIPLRNIDPWDQGEFSELVEYGKQYAIDKKYFLNMRSVMDAW